MKFGRVDVVLVANEVHHRKPAPELRDGVVIDPRALHSAAVTKTSDSVAACSDDVPSQLCRERHGLVTNVADILPHVWWFCTHMITPVQHVDL